MFFTALIIGFLGSFHCIGMCGPIAFMLPVDRYNQVKQFLQIVSYHSGRLFSYTLIGLLFGVLGRGLELFGIQQQLSVITGALMICSVFLPKMMHKISLKNPFSRYIISIKSNLGKQLKQKKNTTFFTIGFINGFLPCGFVYLAILGAIATHHILKGGFFMFSFGLGTVPLMSAVVYLGNFTKTSVKNLVKRLIPVAVCVIGFLFILRGLGLNIPFVSPTKSVSNLAESGLFCH